MWQELSQRLAEREAAADIERKELEAALREMRTQVEDAKEEARLATANCNSTIDAVKYLQSRLEEVIADMAAQKRLSFHSTPAPHLAHPTPSLSARRHLLSQTTLTLLSFQRSHFDRQEGQGESTANGQGDWVNWAPDGKHIAVGLNNSEVQLWDSTANGQEKNVSEEWLLEIALNESKIVPPEELYATQLSQLQEMGFIDTQENIRALQASHGRVEYAEAKMKKRWTKIRTSYSDREGRKLEKLWGFIGNS
ncbi:hypothetical protein Droror1_Dr00027308 [Drosera rotundifolia]